MTKRAILNVAAGLDHYPHGQARLAASLDAVGETADRLFWKGEWPPGSLPHDRQPYGFKPYAARYAAEQGYEQILWLDSVAIAMKPLTSIWRHLEHQPALVLGDAWSLGQWTSDAALEIFGIDRDLAMGLQLCWAGTYGLDLTSPKGRMMLELMEDLRDQGAFKGSWRNDQGEVSADPRCRGHRHDQSVLSWACYAVGVPMVFMRNFVRYEFADAPDACIWATGI